MQRRFDAILPELAGPLGTPEAPVSVLLGVSGGMDSMAMASLFLRSGTPFGIAHCNFRLRGEDSEADASLVRSWAMDKGIACHTAAFDTEDYARTKGISIEMAARELRYRFFAEVARESGYGAVAVAHHADDNAETLLLNLLRGTGVKGLCGMKASGYLPLPDVRIPLLRPLLSFTREEIARYIEEEGIPYREDRTNGENTNKRNIIRNRVFPIFKEINPSFLRTLTRDMARFEAAEEILEEWTREHPEEAVPPVTEPIRYKVVEEPWDGTECVIQPSGILILDADRVHGELAERGWEPGDWIRPLGMRGRKKLQDWFTDHHVPVPAKKAAVLFYDTAAEDSRHILAIAGGCIDDSVKVTASTRRIWRIAPAMDPEV